MNKQKAFTLIELMITVAIVGILASIAIPSYQDSVMKSRRADAKGELLGFANAMERYFTVNNKYTGAATEGADTGIPAITTFSATIALCVVTPTTSTPCYNLTINVATASTYVLYATPIGPQAGDKCGTLTLTHTGLKGVINTPGAIPTDCW